MTFHKIDMQAWKRKKRYEHYAEAVPCTYSMTVALDVTKLLCGVREKGLPFFPVVLYGLAREVNRHAEFRMAQDEMGNVGYYSHCDPCYTVFHKETESFTEVWTAYDASPAVFLARYREDMARYRNAPELSKPPAGGGCFSEGPARAFRGFAARAGREKPCFSGSHCKKKAMGRTRRAMGHPVPPVGQTQKPKKADKSRLTKKHPAPRGAGWFR